MDISRSEIQVKQESKYYTVLLATNYIGQTWKNNTGQMHTTTYSYTNTVLRSSDNIAMLKLIFKLS